MRELLSYGLIHPAFTEPERNQITQWANKISNIALKGNNDGEKIKLLCVTCNSVNIIKIKVKPTKVQ